MPIEGGLISSGPSGTYYSWDGIKNILGQDNAEIASQLDGSTSADLVRVALDGGIADDETNRRARNRGLVTPIADTSADFRLVQQATDLYASWLLVQHREWFEKVGRLTDEQMAGLEKRYLDAYRRLFGTDDVGIEAEANDESETNLGVPTVALSDGSAAEASDLPVLRRPCYRPYTWP